jgi:Domain of unknown function (DUF4383)
MMKAVKYFALISGISYLIAGVMGFIPGLTTAPRITPEMAGVTFTAGYGELLGLFTVNILHNIVHLIVGGAGIAAYSSLGRARLYSKVLGVFYTLLAIMGLFPLTRTTLGLIPIFGNDIWLHGLTAAIAIYFGFIATSDVSTQERTRHS